MTDSKIYEVLKQIDRGVFKFQKLKLISQMLEDKGLIAPIIKNDAVSGYKLTIQGKIFMWDNENWRL